MLRFDADRADAEFVIKFVSEELYNHEEFFHLLKEMKIDLEPFGQRVTNSCQKISRNLTFSK